LFGKKYGYKITMAESDSLIYGALIANGLIAITKFAAAF
jgi:hypothetical protein